MKYGGGDAARAIKCSGEEIMRYFAPASCSIETEFGVVDAMLGVGGLCEDCWSAIEEATGEGILAGDIWSREKVSEAYMEADWDRVAGDAYARESARAFLVICASIGSGIEFGGGE